MKTDFSKLYYFLFALISVHNILSIFNKDTSIIPCQSSIHRFIKNTISENRLNADDSSGKGSSNSIRSRMKRSPLTTINSDTSEVLALVGLNNKYGFIDRNGREVVPVRYESIGQNFCDGLVAVRLQAKWGFVDKNGVIKIPLKYDFVDDFCNGLALVKRNNKYGFVDKEGREVIPVNYSGAGSFHEGLAMVHQNGKRGFINSDGKEVIPIKYDFVFDFMKVKP